MKLSVYYDEIDGELYPERLLLPIPADKQHVTYSIEAPFERFYSEDFHDSIKIATVTQAALRRDPFNANCFSISISQVIRDLKMNNNYTESLNDMDYFIIQMADLEELMQMNVRDRFAYKD